MPPACGPQSGGWCHTPHDGRQSLRQSSANSKQTRLRSVNVETDRWVQQMGDSECVTDFVEAQAMVMVSRAKSKAAIVRWVHRFVVSGMRVVLIQSRLRGFTPRLVKPFIHT